MSNGEAIPDKLEEQFRELESEVADREQRDRQEACPHEDVTEYQMYGKAEPFRTCRDCGNRW